jgi:hypothetical protein
MTTIFDAFYTDDLADARAAYDLAYADARDALAAASTTFNVAYADARATYAAASTTFNVAYAAARATYAAARDATPPSDLIKASPALLAAARLALDYLETLPHQPSIHPSTRAQDALHDAIVAAQGLPT